MKPNASVLGKQRRGSTLVIVISMLALLSLLGVVFYTFAMQERSAAEYFAASEKIGRELPPDPFDHANQTILMGADRADQTFNILYSHTNRYAIISNMMGSDLAAHSGEGIRVTYTSAGLPIRDENFDGNADDGALLTHEQLLNFVDSPMAWADTVTEANLLAARQLGGTALVPTPDVDYTIPDINNLFLGWKGDAIRDTGTGGRFEVVPVIIPSFFRPQYMKSGTGLGPGGNDVPTDPDWYDPASVSGHGGFQQRSFIPHLNHVGGYDSSGTPVYAYLEATRDLALLTSSGLDPFPFLPGQGNNSANYGHLGVWTGHDPTDFELQSDNDGDGIKEGIWLNLGYPVEETDDGRFYTTLFSYTIYDLDGLLDLNVVGNLAQLPRDVQIGAGIVGPTGLGAVPLSDSNMGIGPSEISPIYALLPDSPDSDTRFTDWYTANPSSILEQANMEWLWLLTGRMDWNGSDWTNLQDGRWGEVSQLYAHKIGAGDVHTLPRPGASGPVDLVASPGEPSFNGQQGVDDDGDSLEGIASVLTGIIRGFVHPADFAGTGSNRNPADFRFPNLVQDLTTSPEAWMLYGGYTLVGNVSNVLTDSAYIAGRNGTLGDADDLVASPFFDALFEHPLEMILDLQLALRPEDEMFSVQDLLIGHLTDTDVDSAQGEVSERLRELMPFAYASTSDRRERFTTLSNSLRRFSLRHQLGPDGAAGGGDDGPRAWEWNADNDADGAREFPPAFGTVLPYAADDPFRSEVRDLLSMEVGSLDNNTFSLPLSINHLLDGAALRKLTEHPAGDTVAGASTVAETVTVLPVTAPAYPPTLPADTEYWARVDRQKLARDIYVLLYTIGGAETDGSAAVLDYTGDNGDLGTGRNLYSDERLRQMAQFAVNLVDAMDTDAVVTTFEYDKNLNNGWGLDDLPWTATDIAVTQSSPANPTANGLYPNDAGDRGVVFGVEAQQLVFSEVLGVRSSEFPTSMADSPASAYDDTNGDTGTNDMEDRFYLHLELQNMLPMPVDLDPLGVPEAPAMAPVAAATKDQAVWRLGRYDRTSAAATQAATPDRTAVFMDGNGIIAGGARFTVAMAAQLDNTYQSITANPTTFGTADLYVDDGATPADGNFDLVSPDATATPITIGATPAPLCDLDFIYTNPTPALSHDTRWILSDGSNDEIAATDRGQFLEGLNDPAHAYDGNNAFDLAGGGDGFELVLERRMNPNLPLLSTAENPWIEVDRVKVEFAELFDTTGATAVARLADLLSHERQEPLNAATADTGSKESSPVDLRYNSIGNVNDKSKTFPAATVNAFELWQAHFDRDYMSSGELLNLPVVGPKFLTRNLDRMRYAGMQQAHLDPTSPAGVPDSDLIAGAAGMFLQPQLPGGAAEDNNAWYRLLQFIEVPSRVNRRLGSTINVQREPGKLNLNTVRHRSVLAGLLDDVAVANYAPVLTDVDGDTDPDFLISIAEDGNDGTVDVNGIRDRWLEFINERDGYVPTYAPTAGQPVNMWLPGVPNSRPFRSTSYTHGFVDATRVDAAIDETILRRLSVDRDQNAVTNQFGESTTDNFSNRHWLEAGDRVFHKNPSTNIATSNPTGLKTSNMVHRHQFLSKVMNNTTTVSNCFVMYATAAYFETVYDPSSGVFRIGGRMGLDFDGDGDEVNDSGWEKRAVFLIDRTELLNAWDATQQEFDWQAIIKDRLDLASDGS